MFTGIIEELGEVVAVEDLGDATRLTVRGERVTADATHGDSIAVNGVCLTVTDPGAAAARAGTFTADVMAETLRRSSLGALAPGSRVNLERPMALGGRLDGHLVQGHVDGTATILERRPGDAWEEVRLSLAPELAPFVVDKGSICLDGVSLTLTRVGDDHVEVALIPTTLQLTTLGRKGVGDRVNVEVDVLGKYVQRLLTLDTQDPR